MTASFRMPFWRKGFECRGEQGLLPHPQSKKPKTQDPVWYFSVWGQSAGSWWPLVLMSEPMGYAHWDSNNRVSPGKCGPLSVLPGTVWGHKEGLWMPEMVCPLKWWEEFFRDSDILRIHFPNPWWRQSPLPRVILVCKVAGIVISVQITKFPFYQD
jgi:hypothetical protein